MMVPLISRAPVDFVADVRICFCVQFVGLKDRSCEVCLPSFLLKYCC